MGSFTQNVDPRPTSVSNVRVPPCFSVTSVRAMVNPRPVPLPTGLVVKKGLKIRSRASTGMPTPVSLMPITIWPSAWEVRTVITPGAPVLSAAWMAWAALTRRLRNTWLRSPLWHRNIGSSSNSVLSSAKRRYSGRATTAAVCTSLLRSARPFSRFSGRLKALTACTISPTRLMPSRQRSRAFGISAVRKSTSICFSTTRISSSSATAVGSPRETASPSALYCPSRRCRSSKAERTK